ncbi:MULTISPECIES: hypothetical protein [Streptomycetaceae]|uniref:hypothetical protein n=1 Tax=Streptomycetaceae TaxID=2062 RepID=UPI001E4B1C98|nr:MULTISPECIES: hypothetical protein [Streptomycetaceae]
MTGIEPFLGQVLPMAGRNATAVVGLALAMAGATAAWKIAGRPSVAAVLPAPRASRVLLTAGAAWLARTCAPYPVAWLAQHGASWGFGPAPTSLLLTATGLCGGLWWLTVPRTRRWWWPLRWVARIPLASALLATALYAPGTHL